jgi:hypothetical protein
LSISNDELPLVFNSHSLFEFLYVMCSFAHRFVRIGFMLRMLTFVETIAIDGIPTSRSAKHSTIDPFLFMLSL